MKICLNWKILVCGLFCVFPVDIIGRTCLCYYWNGDVCELCGLACYLWSSRCYECPQNCDSCSSNTTCDVCNAGYYGRKCENGCYTCRYGSCDSTKCKNGCADEYYDSGGYCQQCINNCLTCNSYNDCTTCKAGLTGPSCQDCKYGYYRNNGQCIQCNTNCLQGKCDEYTGKCTYGCFNGWSGRTCSVACVSTCYSCERYRNATCNACPLNKYGTLCENECSSNCVANEGTRQCNEANGDCNSGCVDGWTGPNCTDRCDVNCISCDASDKAKCHTCRPGFYGQSCENECSSNCANISDVRHCRTSDGQCTVGCVEGWTGSTCREQCSAKCTTCDRQNGMACTSCKPSYYGSSCNIECSEYCGNMSDASRQCQQNDGTCLDDCVTGYTGDKCDVPCDAGCRDDCDRNTGTCQPCKPAYFGQSCQHPCNATCFDPGNDVNVCDQLSGECLFDCPTHLCSLDGSTQDTQTSVHVAVIVGAVGSLVMIILVVAAVLGFMFHRKRRRNMSDPERRITYDNQVHIEDENIDDNVYSVPDKRRRFKENIGETQSADENTYDNVYSVPDKKRRFKENIGATQSAAHSMLLKLSSNGPVTTWDVVYSNVESVPVIPSRLGVDEPADNAEELFEDEASGSVKADHTTFTPSKRQFTKGKAHYTSLTPAPVGPVYQELDTNVDVECGDILAHYTDLTPSRGPVYEELNKNDDNDYGDTTDYEVPTTSNYYNI